MRLYSGIGGNRAIGAGFQPRVDPAAVGTAMRSLAELFILASALSLMIPYYLERELKVLVNDYFIRPANSV